MVQVVLRLRQVLHRGKVAIKHVERCHLRAGARDGGADIYETAPRGSIGAEYWLESFYGASRVLKEDEVVSVAGADTADGGIGLNGDGCWIEDCWGEGKSAPC